MAHVRFIVCVHENSVLTLTQWRMLFQQHIVYVELYINYKECVCQSLSHVGLFVTLWTLALQAPLSIRFSRQEYEVGSLSLLQGIFPTQGLNLDLPHCRQLLYHLSHHGKPITRGGTFSSLSVKHFLPSSWESKIHYHPIRKTRYY